MQLKNHNISQSSLQKKMTHLLQIYGKNKTKGIDTYFLSNK